ncbi:MAG: hypothetical protein U0Y82_06695 [Thermoleophilia bacterium]
MNRSLLRLAVVVGRRLGPAVATALLAAARSWLADPANEQQRQRLVAMLRDVSIRAGGRAGRMAQQLAQQVELRRRSLVAWEREMIALRGEVSRHTSGSVRQAAMAAYLTQVGAGPHLVREARRPSDTRRAVLQALDGEARAVTGEPLGPDERRRALEAIDAARAECYALSPPGA